MDEQSKKDLILKGYKNVNWLNVFTVVDAVKHGPSHEWFGEQGNRMMAATTFNLDIAKSSGNFIKYVDKNGYDFISNLENILDWKTESKSHENMLYNPGGKKIAPSPKKNVEVMLKNPNGSKKEQKSLKDQINTFDSLLLIDTFSIKTYSVGLVFKDDITEEILNKKVSGQIRAMIPKDKINMIVTPEYFKQYKFHQSKFPFKARLLDLLNEFIEDSHNNVEKINIEKNNDS